MAAAANGQLPAKPDLGRLQAAHDGGEPPRLPPEGGVF
jgi:hypothetical protein